MEDSLEKMNDEEVSLPKATIDKIISESLKGKPALKDVKDIVMQCAIEFVHLITSEANELCEKECRKTITHDHVYKALENLGYTHYVKECEEVYAEHTNLAKMRPSKTNKFKDSGLTIEELYEQQVALFKTAKNAFVDPDKEKEEEKK
ncbi:negative cofactor 2 transcription regulator complex subunit ncb2 [Conglomerata obtusa]